MIKAGFILLTITMAVFAIAVLRYAAGRAWGSNKTTSAITLRAALILAGWLVYIAVISFTGIMATTALPPRIPLLLVLPPFAFTAWLLTSSSYRPVIDAIPASWLAYLQSFRIAVELLLWSLAMKGLLPVSGTFEGYNYEILIGVTALLVGYFGFTTRRLPAAAIIAWNIAGLITLAIVVFIFISHAYAPFLWNDNEQFSMRDFASFPYTLLAGFLMPIAVFMHVCSLVKLRRWRQAPATHKIANN
ncbi:MAG: hypothetical protein V4649_13585 [Bacteroidota bacterium]